MLMLVPPGARQPDQIVDRKRQDGVHPVAAPQLYLGQASGTLDPAEYLFDVFATTLGDVIAAVTCGTSVDRRCSPLAGGAQMFVHSFS
jgi:hypothetical protein